MKWNDLILLVKEEIAEQHLQMIPLLLKNYKI